MPVPHQAEAGVQLGDVGSEGEGRFEFARRIVQPMLVAGLQAGADVLGELLAAFVGLGVRARNEPG